MRFRRARVAELVDAHDSKSCSLGSEGSIPFPGTIKKTPRRLENLLCVFLNLLLFIIHNFTLHDIVIILFAFFLVLVSDFHIVF